MNDTLIAQVFQKLGELSGKLDTLITAEDENRAKLQSIEVRVSELEKLRATGRGMIAAVAAFSSVLSGIVFHYLK